MYIFKSVPIRLKISSLICKKFAVAILRFILTRYEIWVSRGSRESNINGSMHRRIKIYWIWEKGSHKLANKYVVIVFFILEVLRWLRDFDKLLLFLIGIQTLWITVAIYTIRKCCCKCCCCCWHHMRKIRNHPLRFRLTTLIDGAMHLSRFKSSE